MSQSSVSLTQAASAFERRRKFSNVFWIAFSAALTIGVAVALLLIIGYVFIQGIEAINLDFLTQTPRPIGVPGSGVGNGIVGSLIIVAAAAVIAFPVGLLVGIYIALFGGKQISEVIRFSADVLASVPSIAIGLFAYEIFVAPFHHFSALSASFAFSVLMMPLIIRTTEGAIRLVPPEMREASVALGATELQTLFRCILIAARPGIMTGLILAIARVTGETAPLLFTAFGSQFWVLNPTDPMAELSLQIFTYAISPYKLWHEQAWGGAVILILAVLALSLTARLLFRNKMVGNV
jgi:phosphate transport system permease protein